MINNSHCTPLHAHIRNEKKRFHKKQGYGGHYYTKCGKTTFIPLTHVYQPTLESDGAWGIWSQCLPNVIYAVKFPFIEIFCCTCEWALQGNMCKHQIVVILTCTNIFQEDIIHYCGTWYGSHRGRLGHMFADP